MILRTLTISCFIILLLLGKSAGWEKDALHDILEGLRQKYDAFPSLTLPYTREVITRSMAMLGTSVKGDIAKGQIYFSPPHFLKLEQKTPRREILATDGHTLWWFIPENGIVYKYPSKKFGKELSLLSDIFQGLTSMEKGFQPEIIETKGEKGFKLLLKPVPPWEEIDRIVLTLTPEYHISVLDIHNQVGGITRFRLEPPSQVEDLDENFFRFIAPEGVRVIEEGVNEP